MKTLTTLLIIIIIEIGLFWYGLVRVIEHFTPVKHQVYGYGN